MHPTESDLLALAHGECSVAQAMTMHAHLAQCDGCRSRYDTLVETDRLVGSLLACFDQPVPPVPLSAVRRPPRLGHPRAIAAGIATLLAVAGAAIAAVPEGTFHAWVEAFAAPHAPSPHPAPAAAPAAPAPTSDGVAVTVDTTATIVLRRAQTAGEIRLSRTDQPTATVRAFGGDLGYTVAPGRIVIDNRAPASRLEITLPRRVRVAALVVGDRVLWRMPSARGAEVPAPDSVLIFDLSDSTSRSSHP